MKNLLNSFKTSTTILILLSPLWGAGGLLAQPDLLLDWAKSTLCAPTGGNDFGNSVAVDGSGNTYITGYFYGTADFDPSAGTANLVSAGSADIFLAKYDASGNYVWAKNMGGTSSEAGNSVAVDASGNAYITGYFAGTADFDPSGGTANLVSAGGNDIFLAKYDASGNYVWAKKMGGTDYEEAWSVALDGSGNAYITGYFSGTVDFNPSAGTANLVSAGSADIFLAKYDASGNYVWAKKMGGADYEEGRSVAVDASGNAYITGYFAGTADFDPSATTANLVSAGGSYDIFLAKYDASGNYIWAKNMGGASIDVGYSVAVDASGNAYITGYFIGTVDFNPAAGSANLTSAGSADIFLAKYDANGNYVWAKNMGGTDYEYGRSVAVDASGNAYITGYFRGTADFDPSATTANLVSAGNDDIFLAKYNSSGNYVFAGQMGLYGNSSNSVTPQSVAVDASGNAYITGYFGGTADFDPSAGTANLVSAGGSADIFLAKYNSSGTYLWAKKMGGTDYEQAWSVALDGSGNAYITGYFYGTADFDPSAATANLVSAGNQDIFLAKYDASGNYIWAKNMGGTSTDIGSSVAVDASGNAYITGYFQGTADFDPSAGTANLVSAGGNDIFLAKYDASGNYVWAKKMGGTDYEYVRSVAVDASGNAYITGYFYGTADFDPSAGTANLTSAGNYDIFLAKYDASGNYVWAKKMGGTSGDYGRSVAVDASGNAYITGYFYGTADFDPSAGTANLVSAGSADIFLAKYDASGNYIWAKNMGGTSTDIGYSVAVDASGNAYITGYFYGTADFDPSAGTANLVSAGSADIFLAKYDASGNYIWAKNMGGTSTDIGYSVAVDASGNAYITGYFYGTADFDPSAGTANLTAGGTGNEGFVARYVEAYTIVASAGANGSIAPSGNVPVIAGNDQAFTITPNANYCVQDVLVDAVSQGAITSYTFTNVQADHTISVTFSPAPTWYLDADNDGYYVSSTTACTSPGAGYNQTATISGDCNDADNTIWQNINGYVDADGDGYTVGALAPICSGASLPSGYSATSSGTDCNDGSAAQYPGAACDDGSACTTGDVRDASCNCVGTPIICDDGDPNTTDSCNPLTGCVNTLTTPNGTWTGNTNSQWNNAGNWSGGNIPSSGDDVVIPTGRPNYPVLEMSPTVGDIDMASGATLTIPANMALTVNGVLTNNGTMTVEDDGSLVQTTGSTLAGSGTFVVKRQGSTGQVFNYWSSPITAQNGVPGTSYSYNPGNGTQADSDDQPSDPGWTSYNGTMTPGVGYAGSGGGLATFTGTVNNGNVTVTPLYHAPFDNTYSSLAAGTPFNLVGNPYPCAINASAFTTANSDDIYGTIFFWADDLSGGSGYNRTDYVYWNGVGGLGATAIGPTPNGHIASGQGFMVQTKDAADGGSAPYDILFTNAMREASPNTQFFRMNAADSRLWFSIAKDSLFNQVLIGLLEDATENEDDNYDAVKMHTANDVSLAAMANGREHAIMAFPPPALAHSVPLLVNVSDDGIYHFTANTMENFEGLTVYFDDVLNGTSFLLQEGMPIAVPLLAGEHANRFYLNFVPNAITGIGSNDGNGLSAYAANGYLHVGCTTCATDATIQLFDMSGRLVLSEQHPQFEEGMSITDISTLSTGVYVVRVVAANQVLSQKIIKQ